MGVVDQVEESDLDEPSPVRTVGKILLVAFPVVLGTTVVIGGMLLLLVSWLTHGFDLSPFPGE